MGILMFICFGWKFMNNSIQPKTCKLKSEISVICILVFVGSTLQNYYSSMLLVTVISYVLCGRRMLKSYTNNVKLLQSQIAILSNNQSAETVNKSPAKIKLNILSKFQKAIVVFIGLKIIFYWTAALLLYEYPWINDIISNMLTLCFTSFLFWDFRMGRSFKPYFYLIDENVAEWVPANGMIKNINYNLSFECDLLIIENGIDYFARTDNDEEEEENEEVIKNYSL